MHTATCAFGDRGRAQEAVATLVRAGIDPGRIRIDEQPGSCVVEVSSEDPAEAQKATRLLREADVPGPAARDPDVAHAPGLRYADHNEPNP